MRERLCVKVERHLQRRVRPNPQRQRFGHCFGKSSQDSDNAITRNTQRNPRTKQQRIRSSQSAAGATTTDGRPTHSPAHQPSPCSTAAPPPHQIDTPSPTLAAILPGVWSTCAVAPVGLSTRSPAISRSTLSLGLRRRQHQRWEQEGFGGRTRWERWTSTFRSPTSRPKRNR